MTPPTELSFLPGVPVEYVLARLRKAGGNEVGSGKLASLESSAALAVNTFGWFHERADRLPLLPMLTVSPAIVVNVEVTAHTFPLALPVQRVAQIIVAGFVWDYNGWNVASVRRFFYANIPLLEYYLYQHPKGSFRVSCHCFLQKLINVFGGNLNYWGIKGSSIGSTWGYPIESIDTGGEGGIETPIGEWEVRGW